MSNKICVLLLVLLICGCFDKDNHVAIDHVNVYIDANTQEQLQRSPTTTLYRFVPAYNITDMWRFNSSKSPFLKINYCEELQKQGYAVECIRDNVTIKLVNGNNRSS
jgi:hypothetical protein